MQIVIGVDSGGSKTRALAVGLDGARVGYAESGGGHPYHDDRFAENIQEAIIGASAHAGRGAIAVVVSGIAGLDRPKDHEWAEKATAIEGCRGLRIQVNDAEIAHFGALEGGPGIICVQGHGSMVLAKTEEGRLVRNYDLHHYADSGGPRTGIRAAQAVIAQELGPEDEALRQSVLAHWGVASAEELREKAMADWRTEQQASWYIAGRSAPLVTEAAENGSPMAVRICQMAAAEIAEAVQMLGAYFSGLEVAVCLSGSCGRSPAISRRVSQELAASRNKSYRLVEPRFTPLQGAALWALRSADVDLTGAIKSRLLSA